MPTRNLDINAAIKFGWDTTLENWKFFLPVVTVLVVISGLLGRIGGMGRGSVYGSLLGALLNVVVAANLYHVAIQFADKKQVGWPDLWTLPVERLVRYVGAQIVSAVLIGLGFLLLIVPGIYLSCRFSQVRWLVVEGTGVWQALDESGRLTQGMIWSLIGFGLARGVVLILGFLAFGVGIFVALPVVLLAEAHVYRQLTGAAEQVVGETVVTL